MEYTYSSNEKFDTVKITGDMNVSNIIQLTPDIKKLLKEHLHKNLVLDFDEVGLIDSSVIQLLINASKRKKEHGRKLYILNPGENILRIFRETKVDRILPVITSIRELLDEISKNTSDIYRDYIVLEGDHKRLTSCKCPVCGSENTVSYFTAEENYNWTWDKDSPFPEISFKETERPAKYFTSLPCICRDCFFTTLKFSDFSYLRNGVVDIKSSLDSDTVLSLAKSITKRQKTASDIFGQEIDDDLFEMPRSRIHMTGILKLAEETAKTGAANCKTYTSFDVGFINYLALLFIEDEDKKAELINSCRTWLSRSMEDKGNLTLKEYAISLFILIVANINMNKTSEAKAALAEFDNFTENMDTNLKEIQGPQNPLFWHKQARKFWENEVRKKAETA